MNPAKPSIFHNATSKVPREDAQIVRVDMQEQQIGGRLSSLPQGPNMNKLMSIKHIGSED